MSVGDLMIFTSYLSMLWQPLCTLTGFSYNMQLAVAGAERVFAVLDRDLLISNSPGAIALPRQPRRLSVEHVWFEYTEEKPVLRGINAEIASGEMVAFVGSNSDAHHGEAALQLKPGIFGPPHPALENSEPVA